MRRLAYGSLSFLFLLAACGDDDGNGGNVADAAVIDASGDEADASTTPDAAVADAMPTPDAQPSNLDCAGDPLPDTAPMTLTVSGVVQNVLGNGVAGATVEARRTADDALIDTSGPTAMNGAYTLTEDDTGQVPLEAYLVATHDQNRTTYIYPPVPLASDQADVPVIMLDSFFYDLLLDAADPPQNPDNGVVTLVVVDCDGNPVEGAVVTSSTSSQVVYGDDTMFPNDSYSATSPSGIAYIYNVPPTETEVGASVSGVDLRAHTVGSVPGAVVTTAIIP